MTTRSHAEPDGRVRVLLVDDHKAMLARSADVLRATCVIVGTATNGPDAIDAARTLSPDVIVLDISMPGMNGLEVAAALRDEGSKAAILFLSMHDGDDFLAVARAVGGIGFVTKTRLGSDLVHAVREASAGRPFISSRTPDAPRTRARAKIGKAESDP